MNRLQFIITLFTAPLAFFNKPKERIKLTHERMEELGFKIKKYHEPDWRMNCEATLEFETRSGWPGRIVMLPNLTSRHAWALYDPRPGHCIYEYQDELDSLYFAFTNKHLPI